MREQRPNPEFLLKRAEEEEREKKGGRLKIYLGAAPGVGKTYTMLQDALAQRGRNVDVVIGIAESHGRLEIDSLLEDLEIIPRHMIDYHGQHLSEFDLDAALKRNPQLILVDEMAHTNAPGSRHKKRWQDIKELMDRGINVYTTLNVQHIESISDSVSHIIHAPIKETIPDSMLELADTIELVDLPPEDLLKRLQEGKVYYPDKAALAQKHFFRKGNLIALRELALRITAERVGTQVLLYRQGEGIEHIWPTKEKILVCVGPGPESLKLIRAACRSAANTKAEWFAVYADTPHAQSAKEDRNNAIEYLRLAEQLGAETRILIGTDIVKEILNYAHTLNITQIMIWKHIQSRWKNFFRRNLTDELVRYSGEIDIYIITGEVDKNKQKKHTPLPHPTSWRAYFYSLGIVAIATAINFVLFPYLRSANLIMIYVLAVVIVTLLGQTKPAILAAILSIIAFDFFFVSPFYTFAINNFEIFFTLILMLLITQVVSHLTILTRRQAEAALYIESQTSALYNLSRRLANTRGTDKLLEIGIQYIDDIFNSAATILLPQNEGLEVSSTQKIKQPLDAKEKSVAQWVYEMGQIAGLGTDTLPFSNALYIPLSASQGTLGVLRIQPKTKDLFSPEQIHLLESCANQIALALEVDNLQENARKSELQYEANRVRNALLRSISHDLRTPLVSIMGSASTQIEMAKELDVKRNIKLAKSIYSESEQLSRLINNLLQISYLESENVQLQKQLLSLKDTITTVLNTSTKKLGKRTVNVIIPDNLPKLEFDNTLIQEVFYNLLDNAVKFTPPNTAIDITVQVDSNNVLVKIEDGGPGIVPDEVDKLFEKFYRGRLIKTDHGLGLGLAICRHIIKAHGGDIWAENRSGGGAVFCFRLPLSRANEHA